MCGISGIYNYLNKDINSKNIIKKIVDIQRRRGPEKGEKGNTQPNTTRNGKPGETNNDQNTRKETKL